ncbi:hypothetical protein [Bradyrhizobium sp. AZCC 2230]|uniref:hypothetical protein n=1 Tax=Bradyrhizobium sp. AZCC 2230 TaxID=3117021 RepID=UPI002FEF98FD
MKTTNSAWDWLPLSLFVHGGSVVNRWSVSALCLVRQQNVAQMAFAEDYDMINAFPPD